MIISCLKEVKKYMKKNKLFGIGASVLLLTMAGLSSIAVAYPCDNDEATAQVDVEDGIIIDHDLEMCFDDLMEWKQARREAGLPVPREVFVCVRKVLYGT